MANRNMIKTHLAAAAAFLLLAGGVAFAALQFQSITLPSTGDNIVVNAVLVPGASGDAFNNTGLGWVDDEDLRVGFGEDGYCRINGGTGAAYTASHQFWVTFDLRLVGSDWQGSVSVYDTDDNDTLILSETGINLGSERPVVADATGLVVASLTAN